MITSILKNHPITVALNKCSGIVADLNTQQEALFFSNTTHEKTYLIVKPNLYQAQKLYQALYNLLKEDVVLLQCDESLRLEEIASSPETNASLIETLDYILNNKIKIIVTHIHAYLRYLPNPKLFKNSCITLQIEKEIKKQELENILLTSGYSKVMKVDQPLTFASRGSIIDIFSINYSNPIRIEFFDNNIESIRFFNIETQRTIQTTHTVNIIPATTLLLTPQEKQEIKDLIPKFPDFKSQIEMFLDAQLDVKHYKFFALKSKHYHILDYLDCTTIFSNTELIQHNYEEYKIDTSLFLEEINFNTTHSLFFDLDNNQYNFEIYPFHENSIPLEIESIVTTLHKEDDIFNEMLQRSKQHTVILSVNEYQKAIINKRFIHHSFIFTSQIITDGFIYHNTYVYSSNDIFKQAISHKKPHNKFKNAKVLQNYQELNINDYIVHEKYGIGKYLGIVTKIQTNINKDYLSVEYANNTKLFIPVEQFQLVRKFMSKEALNVTLSVIGSNKWTKEKEKIQAEIAQLAQDLLQLYTKRQTQVGYQYPKDDEMQQLFEQAFPYDLTLDQKKCIQEIKKDMESTQIMDRLLCGDVGFGKTEVAAVAAFKAVNANRQVAYLCPTTILSMQHYETFIKRFKRFPVKIALLNRFVDKKTAQKIIQETLNGNIDILIGTHRILSKDVNFKNLGLLIIDEEQRFGVTQKEKIKQLKTNIDVLSLSATPIPRTLQMSLMGIRSLSQLYTPPKNRQSVQTYILEYNKKMIYSIISKEIARGGQIFYLFNDTQNIYDIAFDIQNTIINTKVAIGHGKMSKTELENVMHKFNDNEFNVLVCTTIIETGIDIPNANTIIIHNADQFGLSQLYQIKGRVGRGDKIAYAYLVYEKGKILTNESIARLQAIKEFTKLGSGYKIAMRDLSIRGAGSILGGKQAGFIDTVGIDLYLEMFSRAIDETTHHTKETIEPSNIQIEGYLPQSFSEHDIEKLEFYQRLNTITTLNEYTQLLEETIDIFGKIPKSVKMLFEKRKLDILLNHPFIESHNQNQFINITFSQEYSQNVSGEKLFQIISIFNDDVKISYQNKKITMIVKKVIDYIEIVNNILEKAIQLL